jgi:hypothetical protein
MWKTPPPPPEEPENWLRNEVDPMLGPVDPVTGRWRVMDPDMVERGRLVGGGIPADDAPMNPAPCRCCAVDALAAAAIAAVVGVVKIPTERVDSPPGRPARRDAAWAPSLVAWDVPLTTRLLVDPE